MINRSRGCCLGGFRRLEKRGREGENHTTTSVLFDQLYDILLFLQISFIYLLLFHPRGSVCEREGEIERGREREKDRERERERERERGGGIEREDEREFVN